MSTSKTPHLDMAKTAAQLVTYRKEVEELKSKLAAFEKRAEAEQFLIDLAQDPHAPLHLKPSGIADFLEKRASVEKLPDIAMAKTAAKMAGSHGFEIGEVEEPTTLFESNGSRADDEFTEWILGSQG